ncbi:hypothetical protein EZV62_015985 [Acer yangbiense]|uniref:FPL domain-containing protein n=1 Tax=Acer yangbiense TaxID=1000413 RepID=A0A5C7HPC3_9ROSI|nr:hypothetical protein EZV62_015985 [Acer yangbiense]
MSDRRSRCFKPLDLSLCGALFGDLSIASLFSTSILAVGDALYVINELRQIKVVDKHNRELVIDLLQSIVEIVTYGDRQDPLIFECFMECQVLAEFVRVLKISRKAKIEAPLLQYLSIMIQNMESEHAIYYCLSNDYINSIIAHTYEFDGGDLAPYYMSFLRAVSNKINRDTLCLLVKVNGDVVTSFPLYSEALKFAQHGEKMIQTAYLFGYAVSDGMVYQFVTTPPVSKYFSDLVHTLREKCVHLDGLVQATEEPCTHQRRKEILLESDKIVDDLYYFKDVLSVGDSQLSKVVTQNLLNLLVFPILFPLLQLRQSNDFHVSVVTSMYIVSHLLQVVGGKNIINSVAAVLLFPYKTSNLRDSSEGKATSGISHEQSFFNLLNDMEIMEVLENSASETAGEVNINGNHISGHLAEYTSSNSHFNSFPGDNDVCIERSGILAYICSDNPSVVLASLFLLLFLVESKDLESLLASMFGFSEMQDMKCFKKRFEAPAPGRICPPHGDSALVRPHGSVSSKTPPPPLEAAVYAPNTPHSAASSVMRVDCISPLTSSSPSTSSLLSTTAAASVSGEASSIVDGGILVRHMPQILNALLTVLASQPPFCALIEWHTGWFLRKLLILQGRELSDHNLHLFNNSYQKSCERLQKELDGCWFDHILDTLRDEWANCKTALKEPLQSKNPLFGLELVISQQTNDGRSTSDIAWKTMVDAVKVFILHLQLKAFILKGELLENPMLDLMSSAATDSGISQSSDLSSASFGSEVFLGSGIPCRIAFSNAGVRDIYLIPAARGLSGKLILAEKHPFRSQRGVVIAIAPLAGLSPKIDKDHQTWLHLWIREFDPISSVSKTRGHNPKKSNSAVDGRWTLGFPGAKACEAARLLIHEETCKQRSFVESKLAPLLQNNYTGDISACQDQ